MTSSFFSALSGMRANQDWIDLIGNNLANANTSGFKATRATFASAFSRTLRFGTGPTGNFGGANPVQLGLGVSSVRTARNLSQGALTSTGRVFDLSMEGDGYFALLKNNERFYTRVGAFGLDAEHNLVDQSTGNFVLDPAGQPVNLDVDSLFPPKQTDNVFVQGNLPAVVTGPLAEVLTTENALKAGTSAQVTSITAGPNFAATPNAAYTMELSVAGGVPQLISVAADGTGNVAIGDVIAAIDSLDGVSAQASGNVIQVTSDRTGADITLRFAPGSPNDLTALIGMPTTQFTGTEAPASLGSSLNELTLKVEDYQDGDTILIEGVDTDGTPVNASFTYGIANDGTTIGELTAFINGQYADAEVSLNAAGQIVVESQTPGESNLLLAIVDASSSSGQGDWFAHGLSVATEGTGPDEVVVTTEAYDEAGVAHTMTLTYQRQPNLSWNIIASIAEGEGTVLSGGVDDPITGLTFDENGSPTGLGGVDSSVVVNFTGQVGPQTITLDVGRDGEFDGVTQFGSQASLLIDSQDGYSDGVLANVNVDGVGRIEGFYTNGQTSLLGELGIATFPNEEGLSAEGDNLFQETSASGEVRLGRGTSLGRGAVVSGALENSNVDTAEQFVRLIEAQRGFQANARVISTQDEVLAEVVNLI